MFYSGATFESHEVPAGLAGLQSGTEVEGLRCDSASHWLDMTFSWYSGACSNLQGACLSAV